MSVEEGVIRMNFQTLRWFACGGLLGFALAPNSMADTTWNYAVQISATVQAAPPQIALKWPQDDYGATSYTVYRKTKEATSWGTESGSLLDLTFLSESW